MLPEHESLTVEFKSEKSRPQTDNEIIDNVVAFANTEGGSLYLGVEDDGTVTGINKIHQNTNRLAAFIYNKTVPPVRVRVEKLQIDEKTVICIEVDKNEQIVASRDAKISQRRLKGDGSPEVVPLYPSEFISRLSQQRQYDYSDQIAPTATYDDLNPASREKLREHILRPAQITHC